MRKYGAVIVKDDVVISAGWCSERLVEKMYITEIDYDIAGDTSFPEFQKERYDLDNFEFRRIVYDTI